MTHSMTCEQFENILPQLLDDQSVGAALTPITRAHLDGCRECRALLDDLDAIRTTAGALPALAPSRDLWSGIASRIEAPVVPLVEGIAVRRPRRQLTWRTAGIAAAALVAVNLAVTYRLVRGRTGPTQSVAVADTPHATATTFFTPLPSFAELPTSRPTSSSFATSMTGMSGGAPARSSIVLATNQPAQPRQRESARAVYGREITRLRAIVDSGRSRLDPATVAILERNLRVIDTAIEQCNDALARDSSSTFLIESLNNAYQTKVKLLRIAAAAASRE